VAEDHDTVMVTGHFTCENKVPVCEFLPFL